MSGLQDRIQSFFDEQRLERLQHCAEVENALKDCLRTRESALNAMRLENEKGDKKESPPSLSTYVKTTAWDVISGARCIRRKQEAKISNGGKEKIELSDHEPNDGLKEKHKSEAKSSPKLNNIPNCNNHEHAVWACRAKSLSCGAELVKVNKCFKTNQSDGCRAEQEMMGKCVKEQSTSLQERIENRRKNIL